MNRNLANVVYRLLWFRPEQIRLVIVNFLLFTQLRGHYLMVVPRNALLKLKPSQNEKLSFRNFLSTVAYFLRIVVRRNILESDFNSVAILNQVRLLMNMCLYLLLLSFSPLFVKLMHLGALVLAVFLYLSRT